MEHSVGGSNSNAWQINKLQGYSIGGHLALKFGIARSSPMLLLHALIFASLLDQMPQLLFILWSKLVRLLFESSVYLP